MRGSPVGWTLSGLLAVAWSALPVPAQDTPARPAEIGGRKVAAYVGEAPIFVAEVQAIVAQLAAGRQVAPEAAAATQASALLQLVQQRMVGQALREEVAIGDLDVQALQQELQANLARQNVALDAYLKARQWTADDLRQRLEDQARIRKYVAQQTSDERLQKHFDQHRREFDGTRLRVRHILLRVGSEIRTPDVPTALQQATVLRQQILDGKLSFEEAARRYGHGPSAAKGGDLGFIPRHGVMLEPFAQAAFALDKGEISQPVVTTFGVHLIQVTEIEPGKKSFAEVRDQLQPRVAQQVAQELADSLWDKVPVHYTGAMPYFLPGTRRLVLPEGS